VALVCGGLTCMWPSCRRCLPSGLRCEHTCRGPAGRQTARCTTAAAQRHVTPPPHRRWPRASVDRDRGRPRRPSFPSRPDARALREPTRRDRGLGVALPTALPPALAARKRPLTRHPPARCACSRGSPLAGADDATPPSRLPVPCPDLFLPPLAPARLARGPLSTVADPPPCRSEASRILSLPPSPRPSRPACCGASPTPSTPARRCLRAAASRPAGLAGVASWHLAAQPARRRLHPPLPSAAATVMGPLGGLSMWWGPPARCRR